MAVEAFQQGPWVGDGDQSQHDPSSQYRWEAAFALGRLRRGTREKNTLRLLNAFFSDLSIGEAVMRAMIDVYFGTYTAATSSLEAFHEILAYLTSSDDESS
ncbi:hypothetical protein [Tengunoibacter tsumagoiensis]|uniref:Uncharacterized protein n=1 Tax=Tengunoibacter tsumagoiensis TaxID=2014871 RepID=A0A402A5Y2_9CHLR|nr:hypothetical protein [Tengunoibacter tsumagoiensis]GCE14553.1 hypothetical protein KTT_44120 [Tengunoibacter tsumagoiensis]